MEHSLLNGECVIASFRIFADSEDENIVVGNATKVVIPSEFTSLLFELKYPHIPSEYIEQKKSIFGLTPELVEKLQKMFHDLIHCGILKSCHDNKLFKRSAIALSSPTSTYSGVPGLASVTSSRPDSLKRCLTSYLRNAAKFSHKPLVMVADNSTSQQNLLINREVVKNTAGNSAGSFYIGPIEKKIMIQDLCSQTSVSPETISFALFGKGRSRFQAGSNRNTIALFSSGKRIVCVDDDSTCEIVKHSDSQLRVSVTAFDRRVTQFLKTRDQSKNLVQIENDTDFLAWHGRFLGTNVSQHLNSMDDVLVESLPEIDPHMPYPDDFSVCTTVTGVFGDAGTSRPPIFNHPVLFEATNLEEYKNRLRSREIFETFPRISLCNSPGLGAVGMGFDYSKLMPPFIPEFRHEDDVFAKIYQIVFPTRLHAFMPFAVTHTPDVKRFFNLEFFKNEKCFNFYSENLLAIIRDLITPSSADDSAETLRRLGTELIDISRLDSDSFFEFYNIIVMRRIEREKAKIERKFSMDIPEFWRNYLSECLEGLGVFTQRGRIFDFEDLSPNIADGKQAKSCQDSLGDFGALLLAWETLMNCAAQLSQKWRDQF